MTTPESREANKFKFWESYPVRERREMVLRTFEYEVPFKYHNVVVHRSIIGGEPHGFELGVVPDGMLENFRYTGIGDETESNRHADGIVITEESSIVRVAVVGSACTPPGYVTLEGDPIDSWRNHDEVEECMPVRMRIENLWGQHLRFDQALETVGGQAGRPLPDTMPERWKEFSSGTRLTYREFPLAGMSSAVFETPPCKSVRISAGSTQVGWTSDNSPDDHHYSIRTIRVTVDGNL
jgi:hypothetical protein